MSRKRISVHHRRDVGLIKIVLKVVKLNDGFFKN